tara:strand:+ start:1526 stop:3247 length:1722 start_codon:yes stop_codon:yes gene_type:complete
MDMSTSYTIKAKVTGQDSIGGLNKGLGKLKTTTNNNVTAMNKLRDAATKAVGVLKAIAPAIGVAAMGKFVSDTLTAGDRLEKFSQSTGVAVPLLDKMRKASELAGTDFNTLVKTFPMLANNINLASSGSGKAAEAFKKLGVSATNSDGSLRASDQVLLDISDKFKGMEDGVKKASIAYDIFGGKTGEQLIPLLNGGRESIEGLGTAMTEHGVKRMAAFNDSITSIQHIFQDLFVVLTDSLLPVLEKFVGAITFLVEKFVGLPKPVQAVIGSLGILVPLVITIVPLLGAMAFSIKAIAAVKLGAMFAAAVPAITGLAATFAPFLIGGAIVVGIIALGKLIGTVAGHLWAAKDRIGEGIAAIGDFFNAWKESVVMIMQAIGNTIREPFNTFTEFVSNAFTGAVDGIRNAFQSIPDFVRSIINAATAPIRTFMNTIKKALAALRNLLRRRAAANSSSNNNGGSPPTPRAKGGLITSPEVAYIGEQGNEYIIPARKAGAFSRNYLAGMRGNAAIPRFAEGGFTGTPNVNITTGAVTQMNGTNFITTNDLASAVQSGIDQTLTLLQSDLRTRRSLGMA